MFCVVYITENWAIPEYQHQLNIVVDCQWLRLFQKMMLKIVGLQNTTAERYAEYFRRNDTNTMWERLCTESFVMDLIRTEGTDRTTFSTVARMRTMINAQHPGWCMGEVFSSVHGDFFKRYVGQSPTSIRDRLNKHNQERQVNQSKVFYHVWNKPSLGRDCRWVVLGKLSDCDEDKDDQTNWTSLVEMFYCLAFQTLQEDALRTWLAETGHRVALPHTGLNVALPLYQARQGDLSASERGFNSLFLSSDPELREMALAHMKGICRLGNEQAYMTHQADQYSTLATSVFNSIGNKEKRRRRVPGDPSKIMMICSECRDPGSIREEVTPLFEVKSGKWYARSLRCMGTCTVRDYEKKSIDGSGLHGLSHCLSSIIKTYYTCQLLSPR